MNLNDILMQALEKQKAGQLEPAKALYGQVLQLAPRNADALHLLGCIYGQEGRFDEAIASISAAIAAAPKQPTFYNSLGTIYKDKSEPVAAELLFNQALKLNPKYADAWGNLGSLLINTQRQLDALRVLQQAHGLVPQHEGIMCNMAWAFMELGQDDDAMHTYQRALEAFPNSVLATMGLALCMNKQGRAEEALALADRVLDMGPHNVEKLMQIKATALEALGRLDEACDSFDTGLKRSPLSSHLLLGRAYVRKVKADEPFFMNLMALEAPAAQLRGLARSQVYYALGKAYQDIGDVAAAARHYEAGATNQFLLSQYSEKDEIERHNGLMECMSASMLQLLQGMGNDSDRPIFILGMPRSGTTLVEQILGMHSNVTPTGELPYVNEALDDMMLPGWKLSFDTAHRLPPETPLSERGAAYLAKVDALAPAAVNRRFTDKMPGNYSPLGLIAMMFPNARIIHCRRDPIDTCISCYTTFFSTKHYWSYDLGALGRHFKRYWDLMAYWRTTMPGRFLEVRYEQVVDNTEEEARRLLDWCGLEWEPQVLNFHESKRQVTTASVAQVRQPIYTSSVGRWKKWELYIQPLLAEIGEVEKQYWAETGR